MVAVTFIEQYPGMLLVPSPEPTAVPEAGCCSPTGLWHPASPGRCGDFMAPFVLSFGKDAGTPALGIC